MELNDKLKAILGDDYKDGMTEADVIAVLNGKNIADLSKGEYVSKQKYDTEVKKANDVQKNFDDYKASKMSDEEKAAAADLAKDESIATLTKELNKAKVEKVFASAGVGEDKIGSFADSVTPETASAIIALMKEREAQAVKVAKEEALKDFQSPDGGNPAPDKTYAEMSLDERMALKRADPARYEQLKNSKK